MKLNNLYLFSIVIPCFNEQDFILNVLKALEKQSINMDKFEVIVVDNSSTDLTAQMVWDYAVNSNLNIKMVHEYRSGVSIAKNTGAKIAIGDVILFLDADNTIKESFLLSLDAYINKENCTAGTIRTIPDNKNIKSVFVFTILEIIKITFPKPFGKSFVNKEVFNESGGYDENVVLGENVFFLQKVKKSFAGTNRKFGHFTLSTQCSIRRFEKEGYLKVLFQWFIAYLGNQNLDYKTMFHIDGD